MRKVLFVPFVAILLAGIVAEVRAAARERPLGDKTLVVWASPTNLTQRGGTALTLDANGTDRFDGIVFGEIEPRVWMPGSNNYSRTARGQSDWPRKRQRRPDRFVQTRNHLSRARSDHGLSRRQSCIRKVHDGRAPPTFIRPSHRHRDVRAASLEAIATTTSYGRLKDARVYAQPLDQATHCGDGDRANRVPGIAALGMVGLRRRRERMTRPGASIEVKISVAARESRSGCLVLAESQGDSHCWLPSPADESPTPISPFKTVVDQAIQPFLLRWSSNLHDSFENGLLRRSVSAGLPTSVIPEGNGMPGRLEWLLPWANGRYHLMYLYNRQRRRILLGSYLQ